MPRRPRTAPATASPPPPLSVDAEGRLAGVPQVVSPNRDPRPEGTLITLVVVHGISLPPGTFGGPEIESLFTNRLDPAAHPYFGTIAHLRVSAHVLIRRDGALVQFVPCADRAWHAGTSCWAGRERCNDFSVGIELEGCDDVPYAAAQYAALVGVVDALVRRYPIAAVAGHSEIAPGRKTDPGPAFDWTPIAAVFPHLRAHARPGTTGAAG